MQIDLRDSFFKRLMIALEVTGFLVLTIWLTKAYLADMFSRKPTLQNLRMATKLDPGDSDHHLQLARVYRYSLSDADPKQATEHLKRATELNPRNPEPWLDLASALESAGKTTEAQACLHRADSLAPRDPTYQWAIGNAFLLHGNIDEAFRHFKMVLAGSSEYNQILFSTAWKASGDSKKILEELIPNDAGTEFAYIQFLVSNNHFQEAQTIWQRTAASSAVFPPIQAANYIDSLLQAHRPDEAYEVWSDLRIKGIIKATYEETSQNLVINGGFEDAILNMGFDWRLVPAEGVGAGVDETVYRSPGHSLLIEFSGKENIDYRHLYQFVKVIPKHTYELHGYMRTEGITADSGPRLVVRNAYGPDVLEKFSDDSKGTSMGWSPATVVFTTGPKTDLITVGVARFRSRKFDSLIAGKVWVDDLSLTDVHDGMARPQAP